MSKKSKNRPWRRLLKKQQRKRKRQKLAQQRDRELEKAELDNLEDPLYKERLSQQERMEDLQNQAEEKERNESEEQWLRRELLSQKQFRREEQKRKDKLKLEEELRLQQEKRLKEQEDSRRRKREEFQKRSEQAAIEFEESMQLVENYLEDTTITTPLRLQTSIDSRPGEKLCEFYAKTNCCRFGLGCVYNHQMPMLSNVILIKHFFQHILLENRCHMEYSSADEHLEVSERDFQDDYEEFCADVWPEMESFGDIINFRTVRNKCVHTRGHVFVEYGDKRSALKAFIKLQNRYYASKPLKVEFSHITHWRTAVCGLSLAHMCAKGDICNYLHLMHNPGNKYNTPLGALGKPHSSSSRSVVEPLQTPLNWNDVVALEGANKTNRWRWSESPEIEIKSSTANMLLLPVAVTKNSNENPNDNLKLSVGSREKCTNRSHKSSSEINQQTTLEGTSTRNNNRTKRSHKHNKQSPPEEKRKTKHKSHKRSSSKEKRQRKHKSRDQSRSREVYKNKHESDKRSPSKTRHKKSRLVRRPSEERQKIEKEYPTKQRRRSQSRDHSRKR